jgi:hypothetical protein
VSEKRVRKGKVPRILSLNEQPPYCAEYRSTWCVVPFQDEINKFVFGTINLFWLSASILHGIGAPTVWFYSLECKLLQSEASAKWRKSSQPRRNQTKNGTSTNMAMRWGKSHSAGAYANQFWQQSQHVFKMLRKASPEPLMLGTKF